VVGRRTGEREMGLMGKWKRVNGEDEKETRDTQRNTGGMEGNGILGRKRRGYRIKTRERPGRDCMGKRRKRTWNKKERK
jgi:hypothetical protein